MNSKLSVFGLSLTGILGLGLVTGCGDRMSAMKAKRVSCEEYNTYAKENKLATICDVKTKTLVKVGDEPQADVVTPQIETPEDLKGAEANGKAFSKEIKGQDGQTKQLENGAAPKAEFLTDFNQNLGQQLDVKTVNFVQGIDINSSVKDGQVFVDIQAVVSFKGGYAHYRTAMPQAIYFDGEKVNPLNMSLSLKKDDTNLVALNGEIQTFATCLKEEPVCSEIAVEIAFDVSNYPDIKKENGKTLVKIAFLVKTGEGIQASNLGNSLKNFESGVNALIADEAQAVTKEMDNGPVADPTKPNTNDLLVAAQGAGTVISRKAVEAEEAAAAASVAKQSGQTEEAERQAQLAEAAQKDAEAANELLIRTMTDLAAMSPAQKGANVASNEEILKDSADRLAEVQKFAAQARQEANTAKDLADKAAKESAPATTATAE